MDRKEIPADPPEREREQPAPEPTRAPLPPDEPEEECDQPSSLAWYPDRIDFFVDDQKYFSYANDGGGSTTWPFDADQYLILNLAIGGSWGGQQGVDLTLFPHLYYVDYVRVYRHL